MTEPIEYRAFISCSHEDAIWAKWLHRWLENFRSDNQLIGRDLRGTIHKTLRPIFRDPGNLGHVRSSQQTLAALEASQTLILICSPASARSSYVAEQIRIFKSRHPERLVIPLIVDGKPNDRELECFPPTLKFKLDVDGKITDEPSEVQAVDAREDGETLALAKIVAGMLGVSSDEVFQKSQRGFRTIKREGRRRAMIEHFKKDVKFAIKCSLAAGIVTLIGVIGVVTYWDHVTRQQLAAIDTLKADYGVIDRSMTSAPVTGPSVAEAIVSIDEGALSEPRYAKALDLIGSGEYRQAESLLQAVAEDKKRLATSSKATATAFRNLGSISAISEYAKARKDYAEAAALDPDHVEGMFWHGWFEAQAGALNNAKTAYQRVIDLASSRDDDWALYWSRIGLGDIWLSRGDLSAATAVYQAAGEMADRLSQANPDDPGRQRDLPVAYSQLGDVMLAQGNFLAAASSYAKGLAIIEKLARSDPDNLGWQRGLISSYGRVALTLERQGEQIRARNILYRAREIARNLKEQSPGNSQVSKQLTALEAEIATLEQGRQATTSPAKSN